MQLSRCPTCHCYIFFLISTIISTLYLLFKKYQKIKSNCFSCMWTTDQDEPNLFFFSKQNFNMIGSMNVGLFLNPSQNAVKYSTLASCGWKWQTLQITASGSITLNCRQWLHFLFMSPGLSSVSFVNLSHTHFHGEASVKIQLTIVDHVNVFCT